MSFGSDLNRFNNNVQIKADKRVIKIGIVAYQMITTATHVRDGYLKANWFPTTDTPSEEVDQGNNIFNGSRAMSAFTTADTKKDLWFVNNMPYAWRIEILGSTQGPPGAMINKTRLDLQTMISTGLI